MSDDNLDAVTGRIVAIWRDVFGQPDIDADSHLLDLGATSFTAVRLRSRIRAEFVRDIELIEFLDHPTPRELAPVVAVATPWNGDEDRAEPDPSAEPVGVDERR